MLFSDPHFQWRKKIIICVAFFFIFRTTFSMGEENHHLCCVFFIFRPTFSMGEENHDLFFSDPHFQWRRKIIICVAFFLNFPTHIFNGARKSSSVLRFFIFRPKFSMGEENHHLCCVFFSNSAKTPLCTTPLHLLSLPAHPSSFMMRWD